ncbi:MAG: lipopolysaccharide biosynthesis protein [Thermodesulfobacteriota bacterium]
MKKCEDGQVASEKSRLSTGTNANLPSIRRIHSRFFHWAGDYRKLLVDARDLLFGSMGASALRFLTVMMAAKAMGVQGFGVLSMIQALCDLFSRICSFQTWQAGIRYGTETMSQARNQEFKGLIQFLFRLDLVCGLSGALGALCVFLFGAEFVMALGPGSFSESLHGHRFDAVAYTPVILFIVLSSTPVAIFRLFGRFRLYAAVQFIQGLIGLAVIGFATLLGSGFKGMLWAHILYEILAQGVLIVLSLLILRSEGYGDWYRRRYSGLIQGSAVRSFLWSTFWSGNVKVVSKDLDVVLVGSLGSAAAAGLYRVAKIWGSLFARIADPIHQVIYPRLCRYCVDRKLEDAWHLAGSFSGMMGMGGLFSVILFWLFGPWALEVFAGQDFIDAYGPTLLLMLGVSISAAGLGFASAMLALGRAGLNLRIQLVSAVVQLVLMGLFVSRWGAYGAGAAYLVGNCFWFLQMYWFLQRSLRERKNPGIGAASS